LLFFLKFFELLLAFIKISNNSGNDNYWKDKTQYHEPIIAFEKIFKNACNFLSKLPIYNQDGKQ